MKVPRQYSLVLLVNVGWREGKTFESEEARDENGARREVEQGPTALN
jgi:hypothetical protein